MEQVRDFIYKNKQRLNYDPITGNYMPYGNGCWRFPNCMKCLALDCIHGSTTERFPRKRGS
jgi:hypothetical protein